MDQLREERAAELAFLEAVLPFGAPPTEKGDAP
jgi:hypothetical protein